MWYCVPLPHRGGPNIDGVHVNFWTWGLCSRSAPVFFLRLLKGINEFARLVSMQRFLSTGTSSEGYHAKALLEQTYSDRKGRTGGDFSVAFQSETFGHWRIESRLLFYVTLEPRSQDFSLFTHCFTCHMRGLMTCGQHSSLGEVAN